MTDAPKLLVEWSSPWEEFLTAIRPALARSPEHLAGEARTGLFPYRGMLASWGVELVLLIAVIVIPAKLASLRPRTPPPLPKYDIIYFSRDELPRTEDVGGAQAGKSGRAGGQEARHRTQTIRVARGGSLRDKIVDAPKLNLPRSDSAVANLLAYRSIPGPPPMEGLRSSLRAPAVPQVAVAPAPEVERERMRAMAALGTVVVPPAPASVQNTLRSPRLPGANAVEVVPPPVSAPERVSSLNPQLTLPAPTVVAPPPQVTRNIVPTGPGFGADEMRKQVVPPPVQVSGTSTESRSIAGLGSPSVVPPPVQAGGGLSRQHQPASGLGGGTTVVPPPPTVSGGGSLSGQGRGNRGPGLGGPLDVGSVAAPPGGGGSGGGTGIVVSSQPGSTVGLPGSGGPGSLALSPAGGDKPGLGGSGGGSGIGRGSGPGSGFSGDGSGAGKEGSGRGSDPSARGGISPYPGPGGAGSGTTGTPAIPGVSVRGGSNVITLPSFGSNGNQPTDPGRSSAGKEQQGPGITIVATSRSGGAFNRYGALKGDKVYTIYLDTALGPAVLQYADPTSATHPYAEDLSAPQPLRAELTASPQRPRLVIACILDRSGLLRSTQVLEPASADITAKVLAAVSRWKFRPAMRGDQPVEVNAILGFNIDTRDRF